MNCRVTITNPRTRAWTSELQSTSTLLLSYKVLESKDKIINWFWIYLCVSFMPRLVAPYIDFTCNCLPTLPNLNLNYWRFDMWLVHVIFILFLFNCSWDRVHCSVTVCVMLLLLSRHYLLVSNATRLHLNCYSRCHLAASNWLDILDTNK